MTNAIAVSGFTATQLRTIKNTVASDTNDLEFDLFMEACRSYGLDPFRKQIFAVVYSKENAAKRKMSIIVSRDGHRILAQRCRDYRPASEPPQFEYDDSLKGPTNPKGIATCTVRLWKQDNRGEWYPVAGQADWDEFAPVKEEWVYDQETNKRKPSGNMTLDASGQWAKMPKVMLAKCAESQALRAGWPDQFGGVYSEEEMHRLETEATATEALKQHDTEVRLKRLGGPGLMMVFDDSAVLEKVALGEVFDRVMAFLKDADPEECYKFSARNKMALTEFWGHDKAAALEIKKSMEAKAAQFNPVNAD